MPSIHDQLSEQFYHWERRGRGWQVFDEPVGIEPPFVPFAFHNPFPDTPPVDTGRRPGFLGSWVRGLGKKLATEPPPQSEPEQEDEEATPLPLIRNGLVELKASLPPDLDIPKEAFEQFLSNLSLCSEPIAFELVGTHRSVAVQFAASEKDAPALGRNLVSYFPEAAFRPQGNMLVETWQTCSGEEELVVEFGLARQFMFQLASGKLDPFVGIVGALSQLQQGELGLFQVLWQPAREDWPESIMRSVTNGEDKPLFIDAPELTEAAEQKVSKSLYATIVRIAIKAGTFERAVEIARDIASSLRVFANPHGNELIPLKNDDYPFESHVDDALARQSCRPGMILNSDELIGFVHLPGSTVRSSVLERQTGATKSAPVLAQNRHGLLLGTNTHAGETKEVRLSADQRVYHAHVIGATGTGKSTLLFNLIRQDIENGEGVAVLDPHADLVNKILGIIPPERAKDVILIDPTDEEFSIGFNILSAHSEIEKTLLASDLVSVFQRLSTSWGDQMHSILQHAINAFLHSSRGGTIADLRRFLVETSYRNEFLKTVSDQNTLYYWQKGFPHLSGNKSIGPVLTRLEMLLAQRPIAHMISQKENRLDFGDIMDSGKILLAKLPGGIIGRENSYLLGALLIAKFQQLVMARQAKQIAARRDFWIYIDEFANFITPSMAEILSGARKYRIGLTLAHHELHQLQKDSEVASAVMAHPYTRIVFRVSDDDTKRLAEGFSSFEASDLKNLETGQAICRLQRSNFDFNLSVPLPDLPDQVEMNERRQAAIAASRGTYGTPRAKVEAILQETWEIEAKPVEAKQPPKETPPLPPVVQPSVPPPPKICEPLKAPEIVERKIVEPPRDLGRGGEQHKAIQQRIKKAAEGFGFRSTIEKPVLDGLGSIDLFLERDGQSIACEISLTTTIDHEVGNVSKCLKAGVPTVAVICLDDERLRKIEKAVTGSLGADMAAQVRYFQPDPFIVHLKQLKPLEPQPSETSYGGYKIKRSVPKLSPQERRQKEDLANNIIAEAMRRK